MGRGRGIGVDIEIRPHNRAAIEAHELSSCIMRLEGSSTDPAILSSIKSRIQPGESVLVILDSNLTKGHGMVELDAYHDLVTPVPISSQPIAVRKIFTMSPAGRAEWIQDDPPPQPRRLPLGMLSFAKSNLKESELSRNITYWPSTYLFRTACSGPPIPPSAK